MINDAHCHFFSPGFYETLAHQKGWHHADAWHDVVRLAGWDGPASVEALADRWADELSRHGVRRALMIASVVDDEGSVAQAIERHPDRFVGAFMLNPVARDAELRVTGALEAGLRVVCLFPAMHGYALTDTSVERIGDLLATRPGSALFVHCGVLTVGVRRKLGLPSVFEARYGNPLDLQGLAARHPAVPVILPHFGAGFFREALMVADTCPNLRFDTSSSNTWTKYIPRLALRDVFAQALAVVGPERLLFGTDSSFFPRGWHRAIYETQHAVLQELGVSEGDQHMVLAGNFDQLFPLPAA